jgi:hypothetical protein
MIHEVYNHHLNITLNVDSEMLYTHTQKISFREEFQFHQIDIRHRVKEESKEERDDGIVNI